MWYGLPRVNNLLLILLIGLFHSGQYDNKPSEFDASVHDSVVLIFNDAVCDY